MLNYTKYIHGESNTWVTFVHGAGGSSSIWYKQVREFKRYYNVLLLDLRGHGGSQSKPKDSLQPDYTFDAVTDDILRVIDHESIDKSHFIGISLGTILIRNLAEHHPHRVESLVMGGAIMKIDLRSRFLIRLGTFFKPVVPYLWLYKLFAFIIMPHRNHKESRMLFVNEAKKLCQDEFDRWFKLTADVRPLLEVFRLKDIGVPTLYIMGEEDYLFLPTIKKISADQENANLFIIQDCGHVVNVEQPDLFNRMVIGYFVGMENHAQSVMA
ncbi:alpha/beta hydrolase [Maribacter sp. MMG018]|uniref:alpha/beta fold hydrolase n=1 Tax=Maribacter sp. MMG018 TaxID=2822688 RepID=UPI001B39A8B8|nr:alpha/beta hydrolase [Maribacter sp. MMG018]MBQ4914339.1 alpha/beta hydrolase [Maribacter sp. MMG018]